MTILVIAFKENKTLIFLEKTMKFLMSHVLENACMFKI